MNSLKNDPESDFGPVLALGLGAGPLRVRYCPGPARDPLAPYPLLQREGAPYNRWLSAHVLDPFLARWAGRAAGFAELAAEVGAVGDRGRQAFGQVLPAAAAGGGPAILAALAVTANLLRTVTAIGEALASGRPAEGPPWELSRLWCGRMPHLERGGRVADPAKARRGPVQRSSRSAARELGGALGCSVDAVEASSREAIETLRREIRRSGLFTADDLRQIQADPPRARGDAGGGDRAQEKRSGVVRLRKSSM